MIKAVLKHEPFRILTGKRIKIFGLILILQILFIGPLGMEGYSWGAFRGIWRYIKVTDTHQEIIKAAYNMLSRDPAVTKTGFPVLGDHSFLNVEDILRYEGIDVGGDLLYHLFTVGPGPDADGSSQYSWHWYNPTTFTGYAPREAANYYFDFALATLQTTFDRERALKGMAWSAHFAADMLVPFHVNGVPFYHATPELEAGPYLLNSDESGPLYLCNLTPSPLLPSSYADKDPYVGFGLDNDFIQSYAIFKSARESAILMDNGVNPIDWFDPWYWNGSIMSDARSSHATFELNAHVAWLAEGGTNNAIFSGNGQYDNLWVNGLPDYAFNGNAVGIQSEQVWRFATQVAIRTKNNSQQLFLFPAEGIKQAVFAVYTLWRSAWSALQPGISVQHDPLNPGGLSVGIFVNNYAIEACRNVKVKLTVMDGSAISFQEIIPLTELLPANTQAQINWNVPADRSRSYNIFAEVVGAYKITPDLQYSYSSYVYQPGNESQATEQEVFGNNKWIQNSFTGDIYFLPEGTSQLPDFSTLNSEGKIYTKILNIPERAFDSGFPGISSRFEWFAIRYTGDIRIRSDQEGEYTFRLSSDDGSRMIIDNKIVINNDGQHRSSAVEGKIFLSEGIHSVTIEYFQGPRLHIALILEVRPPGSWSFTIFNKDNY